MGAAGSRTRKLTLENDNPLSVIKVSEDVVQRMKGNEAAKPVRAVQKDGLSGADPYLYEPSLTSIQIRQANVEVLKENDAYWDKRIQSLQSKHLQMQQLMEEEYKKAIEEGREHKGQKQLTSVPCVDRQKVIIACYKKNKSEPMKCAKEVQQFAECVDQRRACLIANKG